MGEKVRNVLDYVETLNKEEKLLFLERALGLECMRQEDVIEPIFDYERTAAAEEALDKDEGEILDEYIELQGEPAVDVLHGLLLSRQGQEYDTAISSMFSLPDRRDFDSDEDYLAALPKTEEPTRDDEPGQPVSRSDAGDRISKRMKVLRRTQVSLVLLVLMFYLGKVFLNLDTKIDAYWVDRTITILVCCLAVSLLVKVFINGKS